MPYVIDYSGLVCAECSDGYDPVEVTVEFSAPSNYPDGYTCDDCWTVYGRVDEQVV